MRGLECVRACAYAWFEHSRLQQAHRLACARQSSSEPRPRQRHRADVARHQQARFAARFTHALETHTPAQPWRLGPAPPTHDAQTHAQTRRGGLGVGVAGVSARSLPGRALRLCARRRLHIVLRVRRHQRPPQPRPLPPDTACARRVRLDAPSRVLSREQRPRAPCCPAQAAFEARGVGAEEAGWAGLEGAGGGEALEGGLGVAPQQPCPCPCPRP